MEYPKPMMKTSELRKMGFPEELLYVAYLSKGQRFAQKINPLKKNSAIVFDTAEFEKWRIKQLVAENLAVQRG